MPGAVELPGADSCIPSALAVTRTRGQRYIAALVCLSLSDPLASAGGLGPVTGLFTRAARPCSAHGWPCGLCWKLVGTYLHLLTASLEEPLSLFRLYSRWPLAWEISTLSERKWPWGFVSDSHPCDDADKLGG